MFTGIIEEIGSIKHMQNNSKSKTITIIGNKVLEDVHLGDSIAVNGVCLTVTKFGKNEFSVDIMNETLNRSSLGKLSLGSKVNLERAMSIEMRFGGHIVSGHIDGMGNIIDIKKDDNAIWYKIKASPQVLKYIVEKGSIALDGISLTVAKVDKDDFSVSIILHTLSMTTLEGKNIGDIVNIENDCIGKYVEKMLLFNDEIVENYSHKFKNKLNNVKSNIDIDFLLKNGF